MDRDVKTALLAFGACAVVAAGAAYLGATKISCKSGSKAITRMNTTDPRSSGIVIHNGVVYLTGHVGNIETLESSDVKAQTEQCLAKIEKSLAQAGTDKSHILRSIIYLKHIDRDFVAMNEVWNAWVDPNAKGTRACVQATMAREHLLVELVVTAALP